MSMLVGKYESNATALRLALQYRWGAEGRAPLRRKAFVLTFCITWKAGFQRTSGGSDQQTLVRYIENQ